MRCLFAVLLVLVAVSDVSAAHFKMVPSKPVPEPASGLRLARTESLQSLQAAALSVPQDSVIDQQLVTQMQISATACSAACSGPNMDPSKCAVFWTEDTTIFDMAPPNGVIRGRAEWQKKMQASQKADPASKGHVTNFIVKSAGMLASATTLGWQQGFWILRDKGVLLAAGRFCAIVKMVDGVWKYHVVSTMDSDAARDWIPIRNPTGGALLPLAQGLLDDFVNGFNQENYQLAFQNFAPDAILPCMAYLGGTSVAFAKAELQRQRQMLIVVTMKAHIDDVVFPVFEGNQLVAAAHGFMKIFDSTGGMWVLGRRSFMWILKRETVKDAWKVAIDFSPNNWVELESI